jgi:hypothetical protein
MSDGPTTRTPPTVQHMNPDEPVPAFSFADGTRLLINTADQKAIQEGLKKFTASPGICDMSVREAYLPIRIDGRRVVYFQPSDAIMRFPAKNGEDASVPAHSVPQTGGCADVTLEKLYEYAGWVVGKRLSDDIHPYGFKPTTLDFTVFNPLTAVTKMVISAGKLVSTLPSITPADPNEPIPGTGDSLLITCQRGAESTSDIVCRNARITIRLNASLPLRAPPNP